MAIANNAAVNIGTLCLLELWLSQGICPVVEFLGWVEYINLWMNSDKLHTIIQGATTKNRNKKV